MGLYGQRMGSVYVPHGLELQLLLHDTCFRCSISPPMFIYVEFFTPEGMDYAHIMLALEEQFMMLWFVEHLGYDGLLILDDANNEGGEEPQLLPY